MKVVFALGRKLKGETILFLQLTPGYKIENQLQKKMLNLEEVNLNNIRTNLALYCFR